MPCCVLFQCFSFPTPAKRRKAPKSALHSHSMRTATGWGDSCLYRWAMREKRLHSTPGRQPPVLFSWQNIYDLACKVAFLVHFSGKFTPPPEGASDLKATQLSTPGLCLRCNPFNAPVKCLPLFAFAGDIFLWSDPWR